MRKLLLEWAQLKWEVFVLRLKILREDLKMFWYS
jgi:hypothetical protein